MLPIKNGFFFKINADEKLGKSVSLSLLADAQIIYYLCVCEQASLTIYYYNTVRVCLSESLQFDTRGMPRVAECRKGRFMR